MTLINCPECGKEVSNKALNCIHCGFPLNIPQENVVQYCPYCGKENNIINQFCSNCGKSFLSNISDEYAIKEVETSSEELIDIMVYKSNLDTPDEIMKLHNAQIMQNQHQIEEHQKKQDNQARCPKCGSISLSAGKQGFGVGKAVAGAVLLGGIGLLAGGIGANKTIVTCINCGYKFTL